jgi:hypothetical protein
MFTLLTFLDDSLSRSRLKEVQLALSRNRLNPHIKEIIVLSKDNLDEETSAFLSDQRITSRSLEKVDEFRDLVAFAQENLKQRRVILAYPDIFFPLNSGIGSLSQVNFKRTVLALTPYHLSTGTYVDNLYTGIVRPFQGKRIKLHGLDGSSFGAWIGQFPLKLESMKLNFQWSGSLNFFSPVVARCFNRQLSQNYHLSNPSLELVAVKLFQSWHPKTETSVSCNEELKRYGPDHRLLPGSVQEIPLTLRDSSSHLEKYLVEVQTGFYDGRKVVKTPVDVLVRSVSYSPQQKFDQMKRQFFKSDKSKNGSVMSSRLLNPDKVMGAFVLAQQKGRVVKI